MKSRDEWDDIFNSTVDPFALTSFESAGLLEENKRIARRIVKDGAIPANEYAYSGISKRRETNQPYHAKAADIPHFCDDCAHQGNHTPEQLAFRRRVPWSNS